jgi:S-adenosylmethionine uptake transporter
MAAVLFSALGYSLNIVLLRLRTASEDSLTLVTFMNVFPALFLLPWLIYAGPAPAPNAWPFLFLVAAFGIGIWWLMTLAYARAPAQRLAIFEYTGLIWSSLLGYFFFREVPGPRLYIGAAIIIAACLYVAWHTHRQSQREPGPAADILQ